MSTTGAASRCPVRSSTSRSRKARSKRALCATITERSPAKARKLRTAAPARGAPRTSRSAMPVIPSITGGMGTPGSTSVWNVPVGSSASTRTAPISQIADWAGRRPVVSRSTTTNRASSSGRSRPGGSASPTHAPRHASRASPVDDVLEQAPRERRRAPARARRARAPPARRAPARAVPRSARRGGRRRRTRVAPLREYTNICSCSTSAKAEGRSRGPRVKSS